MCGAECIEPGRNSTIGCRMQQGSFDLLDSHAVVERAFNVQLDLGRPVQGSEHRKVHQAAGLSVECSIPPRPAHAQAVVARWNDIINSSARAIEASTYSAPSTSRRIGMPFWNRASSSAMSSPSRNPSRAISRSSLSQAGWLANLMLVYALIHLELPSL